MGYLLLSSNYETLYPIESFDSLIWTDRYYRFGDFEIYLGASTWAFQNYIEDRYIWSSDSDRLMIIEDVAITTDEDDGNFIAVTGRSLESILDRRILWGRHSLTGNFQNGIKKLLDDHAISPSDPDRDLPGLRFLASTDPRITSLTIDAQFFGENLYEVISKLCQEQNIGFRITMPTDGDLVFELYAGLDRSADQLANPQVTFAPNFDNLGASSYFKTKRPLKTAGLVLGEGEDTAQKMASVTAPTGAGSGFNRREVLIDATSVKSTVNEVTMTNEQYHEQLNLFGRLELLKHQFTAAFDGQIENLPNLQYAKDFYMGDIVQIENEYGMNTTSRVTEFIRSISSAGNTAYPTLEKI